MRILYFHQYFNTPDMVGSTRSYEVAKRLARSGHEIVIITSYRDGIAKDGDSESIAGFLVHWLDVPYTNKMGFIKRLLAFLKFMFLASWISRKYPSDVILATSTPLTIFIPAFIATLFNPAPIVFEVRDLWPDVPIAMGLLKNKVLVFLAKKLELFAYKFSTHIVALSEDMKKGVVSKGVLDAKVTVIPNASDIDRFIPRKNSTFIRSLGISLDKVTFVYAGTFGRVNYVDYLVQLAYAMREDKRIHFIGVGSGSEFDRINCEAKLIGVLDINLNLVKEVSKQEIYDLLSGADMACSLTAKIPVLEWNSANKFFDGLAAGCAVFVNHGGWQADTLCKNAAGGQLDWDVAVASEQLKIFLDKPELLARMKSNARSLAEREFSRDELVSRLESVLSGVASR